MVHNINEKQVLDMTCTPGARIPGLIGTHSGVFHADDVFAIAAMSLAMIGLSLVRSRNPEVIRRCQFVLDVGGIHSATDHRYDHHQPGGAGARTNGVPYATFGLLWSNRDWMEAVLRNVISDNQNYETIGRFVDESLVQAVDAADCGWTPDDDVSGKGKGPSYSISAVISAFNPTWSEEADFDRASLHAINFACGVLSREIISARARAEAVDIVRRSIRESLVLGDKEVLVLNTYCPWQDVVLAEGPNIKFVVFPSEIGDWRVQTVPDKPGSFGARLKLPASWAGLRGSDLAAAVRASGGHLYDPEAVFCHIGRFICGATTFTGAMIMARTALEVENKKYSHQGEIHETEERLLPV